MRVKIINGKHRVQAAGKNPWAGHPIYLWKKHPWFAHLGSMAASEREPSFHADYYTAYEKIQ
jgi:hypothetical protein